MSAGLAYWDRGTFYVYNVNPPLPRLVATLPLLAGEVERDYRSLSARPGSRVEWSLADDFVRANGTGLFGCVFACRFVGLALSVLGAVLLWHWGRQLAGSWVGLAALALWCFGPNVLAWAHVVTPDLAAAVLALAAACCFWCYLRWPSWPRAVLAGYVLGLAELTKFTLLVLYPVWLLLAFCCLRDSRARAGWHMLLLLGVSLLVINAGYGFAGTFRPLGSYEFTSRLLGGGRYAPEPGLRVHRGNRFADTVLGYLPVPLPEQMVQGIDAQRADFEAGFPSYLRGQVRHRGWWYYYLYAMAVKLPLGTLLLVCLGVLATLVGAWRHGFGPQAVDELVLLLPPVAIIGFVSSQTGFNHHMRYVLPAFPFLFFPHGGQAPGRQPAWG